MIGKTFDDCKKDKPGHIYADWEEGAFRCLVMRGPSALCAYIGVKPGNRLYGKSYESLDIDCHGGLTWGSYGGGKDTYRTAGYDWFGWDYGHCNDASFYYSIDDDGHRWTPDEVVAEFPEVIEQFKELSKYNINDRVKVRDLAGVATVIELTEHDLHPYLLEYPDGYVTVAREEDLQEVKDE